VLEVCFLAGNYGESYNQIMLSSKAARCHAAGVGISATSSGSFVILAPAVRVLQESLDSKQ